VLPYLLGTDWQVSGFDAATMQYAQMIILWGANVLETRQGAEVPQRLVEARKRGAQIVVIDPRRSATVKHSATRWLPCRPGTDAALMLAVLHVLFSEELTRRYRRSLPWDGLLERSVLGWTAAGAPPQWAAGVCGISADELRSRAPTPLPNRPRPSPGIRSSACCREEAYRLAVALQ
jgi:anaerobic dimethyl sulfoxide reductase subunit A